MKQFMGFFCNIKSEISYKQYNCKVLATRKSGEDLRKDYHSLLDKTKTMRARIIKRADELIAQYPNTLIQMQEGSDISMTTVREYQKQNKVSVNDALNIIQAVEEHIASLHPHQQQKLFN